MSEYTELQEIELRDSKKFTPRRKAQTNTKRTGKIGGSVLARTPSRNSSQVPILVVLARSPTGEMRTKEVLEQLKNGHWFEELSERDLGAVYEKSHKNLFDSIAKFSRKDLVIKKQLYSIGPECEMGVWKITRSGIERAQKEGPGWRPTYAMHQALEMDSELPQSSLESNCDESEDCR
jgi:hypothetical protein